VSHKKIKVRFEKLEDFFTRTSAELELALEGKGVFRQKKDTLLFDSPKSYQQNMGEQRYHILAIIKECAPRSLYQLTKMLGRDFANVKRDCDAMVSMGFMKYKEVGDNRKSKTPLLSFNYDTIEVQHEQVCYSHYLGKLG